MVERDDAIDLKRRLDFIGIGAEEKSALQKLKPVLKRALGPGLDVFYQKVKSVPETSRHFSDPKHMAHAKGHQVAHWQVIADAEFEDSYGKNVRAIGQTHARLGLEPRWYIGGYALVLEQLIHALITESWPKLFGWSSDNAVDAAMSLSALVKAALLDMDLAISTYLDALDEQRVAAERARAETQAAQSVCLRAMTDALEKLADGDLTVRLSSAMALEFSGLKDSFNSSVSSLQETFRNVTETVHAMNGATTEIAVASGDLAHRTEQNAARLEETAAALQEVLTTVTNTAAGTCRAQEVVAASQKDAKYASDVVQQAVETMTRIEKSSGEINQIIGVIDEIAFQTNLLALNAGVEAARAGEAGRGFAVVASEVRALAGRSATAAKQIKALIAASGQAVRTGVTLVGNTGESLTTIMTRVNEIHGVVADIATAAKEQAAALELVNSAITQMDLATQQNAAMAEQATAASQSLAQESNKLADAVGLFKIDADVSRSVGRAA